MKTEFPFSEKIYAQLLRAYPLSHREQYGAAMVQLFRDQCRDAWAEAGNFGLLKLWLRALPDLAGGSIRERLAALNERKTMNEKLANLSGFQSYSPGKTFWRVFAVVFLIVVLAATAVTFILPETYSSTAIIKLDPLGDPHIKIRLPEIAMAVEAMKSERVLTNVINGLNLNEAWGKKYFGGKILTTTETMRVLKQRMIITLVRNTDLVSITVFSDGSKEAAAIANQIAKSSQDYRIQNLAVLENILATASNQIRVATSMEDVANAKIKINSLKSIFPVTAVQIIDPAEPAKVPIKPNKPLNITIGVFGGILLASIIGGLVLATKSIARRKAGAAAA